MLSFSFDLGAILNLLVLEIIFRLYNAFSILYFFSCPWATFFTRNIVPTKHDKVPFLRHIFDLVDAFWRGHFLNFQIVSFIRTNWEKPENNLPIFTGVTIPLFKMFTFNISYKRSCFKFQEYQTFWNQFLLVNKKVVFMIFGGL